MAAQIIVSLSLLVFIHELGHFLAARMFGMRVEKFFIFMDWGGKIWSKKFGDTEWGIGIIPLGGYVKIAGMIDESMDKEQMKLPPQPWEFRSKPAWQRFIVMIGGIVMNIILGVIIFTFYMNSFEKEYVPNEVLTEQGIYAFESAQKVGLQTGDKIVAVNGSTPQRFKDINGMAVLFGSDWKVERNGEIVNVELPDTLFKSDRGAGFVLPYYHNVSALGVGDDTGAQKGGMQAGDMITAVNGEPVLNYGTLKRNLELNKGGKVSLQLKRENETISNEFEVSDKGKLGFAPGFDYKGHPKNKAKNYSWGESFKFGCKEGWEAIYYNIKGFALIGKGKLSFFDSVQSPVGIAKIFGPTWNWKRFWYLTGLISFILAFMNILPIPALDGGHMVFLLIEMVRGKPFSDEFMEKTQMVGFIILVPFMLLIVGKDILKEIIFPLIGW